MLVVCPGGNAHSVAESEKPSVVEGSVRELYRRRRLHHGRAALVPVLSCWPDCSTFQVGVSSLTALREVVDLVDRRFEARPDHVQFIHGGAVAFDSARS